MSSTILPDSSEHLSLHSATEPSDKAERNERNPFLIRLGERVRALRGRRGMTRRAVAVAAGVSERHLANLEYGVGNASILVLNQVAQALHCPIVELVGDETTENTEWLMIRSLLSGCDERTLGGIRQTLVQMLGQSASGTGQRRRVALIGLRGAGKTTLGQLLAEGLEVPFIELSREIETLAGCSTAEIQALYGPAAYRRYERRALEKVISEHEDAVIATPGGLVSDAGTFSLLLSRCLAIWLQASPEDHMERVIAQGDLRPMAASREAMDDLRAILEGRAAFYSKADFKLNTSSQSLAETDRALKALVSKALGREGSGPSP